MQFFVLRVASNKEDRVREALARKVKIEGLSQQEAREARAQYASNQAMN